MKLKKGQNVILSEGEYSDYCILDAYEVLEDFDTKKVIEGYLVKHPEQRKDYAFNQDVFIDIMVNVLHIIKLTPYKEWHIAEYATVELDGDGNTE